MKKVENMLRQCYQPKYITELGIVPGLPTLFNSLQLSTRSPADTKFLFLHVLRKFSLFSSVCWSFEIYVQYLLSEKNPILYRF